MEQEMMLKEILHAFTPLSEKIDEKLEGLKHDLESKMNNTKHDLELKMDNMQTEMDLGFARVDERLDRLGKKQDGMRVMKGTLYISL